MNIVEVEGLNKIYKERDIFKKLKNKNNKGIFDINFSVKSGDVFSIIGLNGAGKTTIMKSLLGLLDIDSGKINIFDNGKLKKKDLAKIGYLPEISYYPKSIKLKDLMYYYSDLLGIKEKKERVEEVLEKVGLLDRLENRLEDFSKGMLQKVGIAQSILSKPKLLFLDEPMSGLDPLARTQVIELIKELKENGTTVFLNTHILDDIEKVGDSGIIVHKGKVIDKFTIEDIKSEKKVKFILENGEKIEKVNLEKININEGILDVEVEVFSLEEYFRKKISEVEKNEKSI